MEIPSCFISSLEASRDGVSIHCMQSFGAPAFIAASLKIFTASFEQFCALGWKLNIIGFLPLIQINDLNIVVDVGFVTGVTPATIPIGSATIL